MNDHRKATEVIISDLRKLGTDDKRLQYLNGLFANKNSTKEELNRRAHVCTAIRLAGLWPQ